MADLTSAQRGAYERLPPTESGQQAIQNTAVTTSAAEVNLNANWGGTASEGQTVNRIKKGGAWFSFQCFGSSGDRLQIRFKTGTSATSLTLGTGLDVYAGTTEEFFVPFYTPYFEVIGSTNVTLRYWMSSHTFQ